MSAPSSDLERGGRQGLARTLRDDAERVARFAADVAAAIERGPDPGTPPPRLLARHLGEVDELRARLDEAGRVLRVWGAHSRWQATVGEVDWPRRREELHAALARDAGAGTTRLLRAWCHAVAVGAWDEAQRLAGQAWAITPEAAWWPERATVLLDALRLTGEEPQRSAARLAEAGALLDEVAERWVAGASASGPSGSSWSGSTSGSGSESERSTAAATRSDVVQLLLLGARVAARAGDDEAPQRLLAAQGVARGLPRAEEVAAHQLLLAAASDLHRTLGLTSWPSGLRLMGLRTGVPTSDEGWLEALRRTADLDCAVERVLRARAMEDAASEGAAVQDGAVQDAAVEDGAVEPGQGGRGAAAGDAEAPVSTLAEAAAAVQELNDLAGCVDRLRRLLLAPPDELVVELAGRLVQEGQVGDGEALLALVDGGYGRPLDLRLAQVQLDVAQARSPQDGADLATALSEVAQQALWTGDVEQAVQRYEESLRLRDDPQSMRSLADSLVLRAWSRPAEGVADLERALDLCARSSRLQPVTADTSWALAVEHKARGLIGQLERPDRVQHLWLAVDAAARAVTYQPATLDRWTWLATRLTSVGAFRAAEAACRCGARLSSTDPELNDLRAIAALNLWRPQDATPFVDRERGSTNEERAWVVGLLAMARRMSGDTAGAAAELEVALGLDPTTVLYRFWRAEMLTTVGDPTAADDWRQVWRDADLSTYEGLGSATWAAVHQGLMASAHELAERLDPLERMTVNDRSGLTVLGLTRLSTGDVGGWDDVQEAFSWLTVAANVRETGASLTALLRQPFMAEQPGADLLARGPERLTEIVRARVLELEATYAGEDDAQVAAELEWVDTRARAGDLAAVVTAATAAVRAALAPAPETTGTPAEQGPGAQTEAEAEVEAEETPSEPVVRVAVAPHWFAGLEGRELGHDVFVRALPDARAVARERHPEVADAEWPPVRFRVEDELGADDVVVESPDGTAHGASVRRPGWYLPSTLVPTLPEDQQAAATPSPVDGLHSVPEPTSPVQRLMTLTAEDVVARIAVLTSVPRPAAAQQGPGPGPEDDPAD